MIFEVLGLDRVRAWEVARGDGSDIYQSFKTNTEDLGLIADYLKYNPSKQGQLKSSFTGAFDKRSFLDDLRESGYQYLPVAEDAFLVYEPKLPEAMSALENLAGDLGAVSGRAKRPESAANRLKRAVDNGWVNSNMTVDEAIDNLWDAIGTRVVLNSSDEATSQELMNRIIAAMNNGDLDIVRVNSLTGSDGFPYFSQTQLDEISAASNGSVPVQLNDGYESGYTVVTIFVRYSDNIKGEIQIIGGEVLELANAEHLVYDAFLNKPYLNAYPSEIQSQVSAMVEPIRNAAQSLSDNQKVVYENYLNSVYKNARRRELSIPEIPVSLPDGYPGILDFDHLIQTEHVIQQL